MLLIALISLRPYLYSRPNKAKTIGGIGIGSTLKRVEEKFGGAEKIEDGGQTHWYWKKGIAFGYDAEVESIFVFKPIGAAPAGFDDALQREQALKHRAALKKIYSTE